MNPIMHAVEANFLASRYSKLDDISNEIRKAAEAGLYLLILQLDTNGDYSGIAVPYLVMLLGEKGFTVSVRPEELAVSW